MLLQCSCGLECPELKPKLPDYLALLLFQGFTAAFAFGASTAPVDEDVRKYAKTIKGEKGTPLHIKDGLSLWPSDRGEVFKYFLWSTEAKLKLYWHILLLVGKRSEMPSALKWHPPQLGVKRWGPILPLVREVTKITDAISQYGLKGIQTRTTKLIQKLKKIKHAPLNPWGRTHLDTWRNQIKSQDHHLWIVTGHYWSVRSYPLLRLAGGSLAVLLPHKGGNVSLSSHLLQSPNTTTCLIKG